MSRTRGRISPSSRSSRRPPDRRGPHPSQRGSMGLALHAVRDHCLAPERVNAPTGDGGRYGRMFDLPALEADESLLRALGAAGGFCDGGDCEEDARGEAGWPFFGQYIAHDLTADRSPLRAHVDLAA